MARYQDILNYMYAQLPMYQRIGQAAFKKDLTNIIKLCKELQNPQSTFPTVHVAGTNGKGSVTHIIAYILQCQGYRVGVYTSPHYIDFRERIKINGTYISKSEVVAFVENNKKLIEEIKPSFFEITVAMAFDHFDRHQVDVAIIEVGLGGRLDSTNIINPLLSVITNISFDHVDMLGDTLPKIASEKAGIIKSEVPVVIGEYQEDVKDVFLSKAAEANAPISWADENIKFEAVLDGFQLRNRENKIVVNIEQNPLKGPFQSKNIVTAFWAIKQLESRFTFDFQKVAESFHLLPNLVKFMGRWQLISTQPDIMVDSGHNEGGLRYLSQFFKNHDYDKLHIVIGFANDKDLTKVLPLFPVSAKYYFAKANVPRGMEASKLKSISGKYLLKGKSYTSVRKALSAAKLSANSSDLIFVGGSIFVVAEVL